MTETIEQHDKLAEQLSREAEALFAEMRRNGSTPLEYAKARELRAQALHHFKAARELEKD